MYGVKELKLVSNGYTALVLPPIVGELLLDVNRKDDERFELMRRVLMKALHCYSTEEVLSGSSYALDTLAALEEAAAAAAARSSPAKSRGPGGSRATGRTDFLSLVGGESLDEELHMVPTSARSRESGGQVRKCAWRLYMLMCSAYQFAWS